MIHVWVTTIEKKPRNISSNSSSSKTISSDCEAQNSRNFLPNFFFPLFSTRPQKHEASKEALEKKDEISGSLEKKRLLSVFREQEHRGGMLTGRVESVAVMIHYRSWNAVSLLQFFLLPLAMYVKSSLWFDQCQTDIWLAGRPNKSIIPFSAQFII